MNTAIVRIDMLARKFNYSILHSFYADATAPEESTPADATESDERPGKHRKKVISVDANLGLASDQLVDLLTTNQEEYASYFLRLLYALNAADVPGTTLDELEQRGFEIRVSQRTPLSKTEKKRVKDALIRLSRDGAASIGRYKFVGNWLSTVVLRGTRTPQAVARYLRHLLQKLYHKAVAANQAAFPCPVVQFTQRSDDSESDDDESAEETESITRFSNATGGGCWGVVV